MEPLRVDIADILGERATSIEVDDNVDLGEIVAGDTTFTASAPAHVAAHIINAGDGVVLTGTVTARFTTSCARCLEDFELEVVSEVEGLYTTAQKAEELPDEQEWEPIGDGILDLSHAIESAVRLELPFAPLHSKECEGICTTCGVNLNENPCTCPEQTTDDGPFAALKGMFSEADSENSE